MVPVSFETVKRSYILLPVAALALTAGALLLQSRSIRQLESEHRALQGQLEAASVPGGNTREVPALKHDISPTTALAGMSKEEMIAAFEELAAHDGSPETREALELALAGAYGEVDPEYVLNYFAGWIPDVSAALATQLAAALKHWAVRDLSAATTWLDRQISEGRLDSRSLEERSEMWLTLEGAILGPLLAVDPQAAARRVEAMPPEQRREVLQHVPFGSLPSSAQNAYAGLVRGVVPQAERPGAFAHLAGELVTGGGFTGVGGFLDRVQANPLERTAAARDAANQHLQALAKKSGVTAADVDVMRQWLNQQTPEMTDRITGKALAEAAQSQGKLTVAEATALALRYHQQSRSDEVLASFLAGFAARSNSAEVRHLTGQIKDPKIRAELQAALK